MTHDFSRGEATKRPKTQFFINYYDSVSCRIFKVLADLPAGRVKDFWRIDLKGGPGGNERTTWPKFVT